MADTGNFKALLEQAAEYANALRTRLETNTAQMEALAGERKAILAELEEFGGVAKGLKAAATRPRKHRDVTAENTENGEGSDTPRRRVGRPKNTENGEGSDTPRRRVGRPKKSDAVAAQ